jgi:hypothetical protein
MKKLFGFLLILSVLGVFGLYSIVPTKIPVKCALKMNVNSFAAFRLLSNHHVWKEIFNASKKNQSIDDGNNEFLYDHHTYSIGRPVLNTLEIIIKNESKSRQSLLQVIQLNQDSSIIQWRTEVISGPDPLERIKNYRESNKLEKEFNTLLSNMKAMLEDPINAYGFQIKRSRVVDTILISKKITLGHPPTTTDVYEVVNTLKDYVHRYNAIQTNPPMLNVKGSGNDYQMMAALPINRQIPEESDFKIKLMIPGNILVTEVKGGAASTADALHTLEVYMADEGLSSPAIPFESLITDRSQQPDTSKWITKVYYPIY